MIIRVGGIIGETSFKFFIQFLAYGALYCAFVLVVMAIYVAEGTRQVCLILRPLLCHFSHHCRHHPSYYFPLCINC